MRKFIVFFVLFASLFSVAARADVTALTCTQTGPTEYKLGYRFTGATHTVAISSSTHADGSGMLQPVVTTGKMEVIVHAGQPGERVYFFLKADTGEQREVSIRHLALQGTPNFRDLGGYETTDGQFVKWGLLYRSGVLTYLTPADYAYLSKIGIRVVCDFRNHDEEVAAPETWIPNSDVKHLALPIGGGSKTGGTLQSMLASHPTDEQLRQRMTQVYADFAFENAPQYAQLFEELESAQHLPLLYHCTAGKDRTGVFSALLLLTLGVPEKTVVADYALTNKYLIPGSPAMKQMMKATSTANSMSQMTPDQQKVLGAADPAYLESTLESIRKKYGTFDNYRRQMLDVSDEQAMALRSELLSK
jgi:protein-tyrosine phosphatase